MTNKEKLMKTAVYDTLMQTKYELKELALDEWERLFSQKTQEWRTPKKIIFNAPATIVFWHDGSKTVVHCQPNDEYDREKGLALCYMKKMLGNTSRALNDALKAAVKNDEPQ